MHRYDDQVRPYVVLRADHHHGGGADCRPGGAVDCYGCGADLCGTTKTSRFSPARDNRNRAARKHWRDHSDRRSVAMADRHYLSERSYRHPADPVGSPTRGTVYGNSAASSRAAEGTSSTSVEASAMATDVRDLPGSSKEPLTSGADASASTTKMTDASPTPVIPKSATMPVALAADPQAADYRCHPLGMTPPPRAHGHPRRSRTGHRRTTRRGRRAAADHSTTGGASLPQPNRPQRPMIPRPTLVPDRTAADRPNTVAATPSERSHHGADNGCECTDAASAPGNRQFRCSGRDGAPAVRGR